MKAPLILADFELAAATLRVPVAAIRAFAEVESRGAGFLPDDRPVILFERHIFRRQLLEQGMPLAIVEDIGHRNSLICGKTPGGYGSSTKEWERLDKAANINRNAALSAASYGAFQVMGFNWQRCGYASVQDLVNAMFKSSAAHLDSFVRFIQSDAKLLKALQAQDWPTCAKLYNGANFAINKYDTRLAEAFARYS
jgi:hypothetical protein